MSEEDEVEVEDERNVIEDEQVDRAVVSESRALVEVSRAGRERYPELKVAEEMMYVYTHPKHR
jgi:hypothetical protein